MVDVDAVLDQERPRVLLPPLAPEEFRRCKHEVRHLQELAFSSAECGTIHAPKLRVVVHAVVDDGGLPQATNQAHDPRIVGPQNGALQPEAATGPPQRRRNERAVEARHDGHLREWDGQGVEDMQVRRDRHTPGQAAPELVEQLGQIPAVGARAAGPDRVHPEHRILAGQDAHDVGVAGGIRAPVFAETDNRDILKHAVRRSPHA